ncbi:uncharacterized protein EV422DRAFT_260386 [Fimicolochytrium jonesii]|uniref:uncharacterized protein n=1 Tax=Fimicolochytrium jonesii TaxID=1396493 RepID=UPI0022FEC7C6|nr:uncharacterized protein EV422DRAFT_260386 [Fimicolochytrium jonesii]KAI8817007.1 hypothetical protein EV422DRAFT_260386 [Fimicolochytrium jonesii]
MASSSAHPPVSPAKGSPPTYVAVPLPPEAERELFVVNSDGLLPAVPGPSTAEIERSGHGVVSYDRRLDSDQDELWRFFLTHLTNSPPKGTMRCHGHYDTQHHTTHTTTNADGTTSTSTTTTTTNHTVFDISITLTNYIPRQWAYLCARDKNGQCIPVKTAINMYTGDSSSLKEMKLVKQIDWPLEQLTALARARIRELGFRDNLDVVITFDNNTIVARSSSGLSSFAHNTAVRCLCVISCLWLIFLPMFWALKTTVKFRLIAIYKTEKPWELFWEKNVHILEHGVRSRVSQTFEGL